jgi:hypothetical protein
MAIGEAVSGSLGTVTGVFGGIGRALPFILFSLIIIGGFFYFLSQLLYNKRVKVWRIRGESLKLIDDKAKRIKDKNGVIFWKFKKSKIKWDVPPDEVITSDSKGKEVAQCYLTATDEVVWIKHSFDLNKLTELAENATKRIKDDSEHVLTEDEKTALHVVRSFKPVPTNHRQSYAYQQEQAKKYTDKRDLLQFVPMAMSGMFVILLLVVVFMFFGKFIDPITDLTEKVNSGKEIDLQTVQTLKSIKDDVQIIQNKVDGLEASKNSEEGSK